jgi:hypothetical protein
MSLRPSDSLVAQFVSSLGRGRQAAIPGHLVASQLGVSERTVRELAGEAVDRGTLVGSTCSGERAGYFLIADRRDLEVATAHLVPRAKALFVRVARLRRAAEAAFGPEVLQLFDLSEVGA